MPAQFFRTTRALTNDSARSTHIAWIVGSVLLASWLAWFTLGDVTVYEFSRQARLEVQQAPHPVASPIAGRIASSPLRIGQPVQAGDVIAELDASSEHLRRNEEAARLAAIPPRIQSIESEMVLLRRAGAEEESASRAAIEGARFRAAEAGAAVAFARDNERRLKEESAAGGVARVEALRAVTETQKLTASRDALAAELRRIEADAQTRRRQQEAQLESLKRSLVSLEGDAATLRATIERLDAQIARHVIRSPVSGRVGEMGVLRPGSYVAEGQKLATIVPPGDLMILADFSPATALGRLQPGQSARMRLDGFPWAQYGTLNARVSRVSSELREGLLRAELQVDTDAAGRPYLQHGMPGTVEVSIEHAAPFVLVLRAAGQMLADGSRPGEARPAERTP